MNTLINTTFESLRRYITLRFKVAQTTDPSELEDLRVEINQLRMLSIPVSILCACDEIQIRFPLLFPLLLVLVALAIGF
jgi:hypothetical protein